MSHIYPTDFPLIVAYDSPESLENIKRHIRAKDLTNDDVKLIRKNGLLELKTRREISYR